MSGGGGGGGRRKRAEEEEEKVEGEEEEEASSILCPPCGSMFPPPPPPLTSRHLATSLKAGRLLPASQRSAGLRPGPPAPFDLHVTRRLGGASQQRIDSKHLRLLLVEPSALKRVCVCLSRCLLLLRPRAQARNPGVEADGSAHQPGQPRGDGGQVSPDAEGPEPGESAAQDDEDLPEVNVSASVLLIFAIQHG